MKGQRIHYSDSELAWIEANKTTVRREAHAEFCKRFNRSDVSFDNYKALCTRKGWSTGRTGQYVKGQIPENNSARTQFKKGRLPHNTKYEGHERTTREGYVEISVKETNPHTGYERRYVLKHRHLWEKLNGPLPADMVLKCLDGNKANTDPSNWEAVPRGLLPRLNNRWGRNYEEASPEAKPVILNTAKLEHRIGELKRGDLGSATKDA